MHDNEDIIKDFLIESAENLDQLDRDFVTIEEDPRNEEILARIFRAIHTIKGTCGFFGFGKLESVTHVGENLLSKARDGLLDINAERTTALLQMVDAVREMLASIESNGNEGNGDYSKLVAELTRLGVAEEAAEVSASAPASDAGDSATTEESPLEITPVTASDVEDEANLPVGEILVRQGKTSRDAVAKALQRQQQGDPRHVGELLIEGGDARAEDVVEVLKTKEQSQASSGSVADSSIRVDVRQLDKLMNMVGELVLARNQTVQFGANIEDSNFQAAAQRLSLITTELQEGVMKTRMQPIGNVWSKFPRVVRDISSTLGKNIRLEMEGQDTELDKTLLEAIKDPLTHIVRNSVDHGIESAEDRVAAGKPKEGRLLLRAYHEGGQVIIEIVDDGGGVNTDRVRAKAIERGLVTEQQVAAMSEQEIANMVFLPGFSTAAAVTNISGRGVGMDVVKTNIAKIGGAVELQSERGRGTSLRIKIPLTLAIVPALIVTGGDDRYAIPQVNLVELVRLEEQDAARSVENMHGAPVYRLRGKLLPLVYLDKLLNYTREHRDENAEGSDAVNIVVLQAEGHQFGLVVESVQDTEEIVVKPLGPQLKHLDMFAGAAIMGDGNIALILDAMGIGRAAGILVKGGERAAATDAADSGASKDRASMLLVRNGLKNVMGIPLSVVARLEEFPRDRVETAGERQVIQYRNQILPLFHLSYVIGGGSNDLRDGASGEAESPPLHVVVYSRNGRDVGFVVDEIVDITEESVSVSGRSSRAGVKSTAVVQGKVTEILDMEEIIDKVLPAA